MDNIMKVALLLFITFLFSVILDILIVRQALGLLFLCFIPGYLFLRLLQIKHISLLETAIFSAATSIAILMFCSLFVNLVGSLLGISSPLSLPYLLLGISALFVVLFSFSNRISYAIPKIHLFESKMQGFCYSILIGGLLFAGLTGALHRNVLVIALSLVLIAATFLTFSFSSKFKAKLYPLLIAVIAIVILFNTVLFSENLFGADVFREFYVFRLTDLSGLWQPPGQIEGYSLTDSLGSMLSITLLPNVLSILLGMDGVLVFKIFYPLVLALIPLSIYALCKRQLTSKVGFIAAFYFMSISIAFCGIEQFSINRQIVGYLFFFLSFFVITELKSFPNWRSRILLFILVSALAVSHYSLAFLFIFYAAAILVLPRIWYQFKGKKKSTSKVMSLSLFVLLVSVILFWNTFISNSPLNQLSASINRITSSFSEDFFNAGARSDEGALSSLSLSVASSFIGNFHKILIYSSQLLIGLGVLILLLRPSAIKFAPNSIFKLIALINLSVLVSGFVIPNLFSTLNTTRFYIIVLPFLSPFVAIGASLVCDYTVLKLKLISNFFDKHRLKNPGLKLAVILVILTFVFQTGLVNHIANDYPYSYSLDLNRKMTSLDPNVQISLHNQYFLNSEVAGAKWLYSFANANTVIYSDINSRDTILASYALVAINRTTPILNQTMISNTYVFLKYTNVAMGLFEYLNQSDFKSISQGSYQIYSNGESSVYMNP